MIYEQNYAQHIYYNFLCLFVCFFVLGKIYVNVQLPTQVNRPNFPPEEPVEPEEPFNPFHEEEYEEK